MVEPEPRRRRRPAISCNLCRRRKIRCNRETPCSNCVRSKNVPCVYENTPPPPRHTIARYKPPGSTQTHSSPTHHSTIPIDEPSYTSESSTAQNNGVSSAYNSSTATSSPAATSSFGDLESLKRRIHELENELGHKNQDIKHSDASPATYRMDTATSCIGGTFHIQHQSHLLENIHFTSRNVIHKTRLFGQSHWFNGIALFRDVFEIIEPYVRNETSEIAAGVKRCKALAKVIKANRCPQWPLPPTTDLPQKEVADVLFDCYLRTSESVHRVLHIPTFKKDFDSLWSPNATRDIGFVVQVKLVLAIGSVSYDKMFSLRASAIRWIYEAQCWLSAPLFKSRLVIQTLQTNLLLLIARGTVGVGEDLVWASAGELFRRAIFMGLHVDPSHLPKRSVLAAEMRRRVWNTLLEIIVMSSMSSGGPPLVSLQHFNTAPPGNFEDDQLLTDDPVPTPSDQFTQTSIAITLRKTFPIRLQIANYLNNFNSKTTYEETLRLDKELRAVYKSMSKELQGFISKDQGDILEPPFAIQVLDFMMRRCIAALHAPFFGSSLHEATYAYSRKVVIDTSLKIWAAVYPSTRTSFTRAGNQLSKPEETPLSRFTICGHSFSRIVGMEACLFITAEIKSQLQEDEGLGSMGVRPDILAILPEIEDLCWKCIEAGETNMKGYLLSCLITTQIEAISQGFGREKTAVMMCQSADEAIKKCLVRLEELAGDQHHTESSGDTSGTVLPGAITEDWDRMMGGEDFNIADWDPNGWALDDINMNEFSIW